MRTSHALTLVAAALAAAASQSALAQDKGHLNIYCSMQIEWCTLAANEFAKQTGVKVNTSFKGSGETFAQVKAEASNPKGDVWFGGTGDPHLQAAEEGLSEMYQSPNMKDLHNWAQYQAQISGYKTVGIYSGPLGCGYNTELIAKKKLDVPKSWADLLKPEYKDKQIGQVIGAPGAAMMYIAVLDGNGADIGPNGTLTDPFVGISTSMPYGRPSIWSSIHFSSSRSRARCWSARRASGKASTCRATHCSA